MSNTSIGSLLDLSGQVAIVTGASRGIGRAIAEILAQAGSRVALVARGGEAVSGVAQQINDSAFSRLRQVPAGNQGGSVALAFDADVTQEDEVSHFVTLIYESWGRIDVLVNSVGLLSTRPIDQIDSENWERIIAVNLTSAYLCSRAVVPIMKGQASGRIINIASISARTGGVSEGAHYTAAKGGMISMTKTLARDLAPYNVTVNAVAPGTIDSHPEILPGIARQYAASAIPLRRLGTPYDVAYAVLFLASTMAAYITGATLEVGGGV